MFQQGLSATTREVELGTDSHGLRGRLGVCAWRVCTAHCTADCPHTGHGNKVSIEHGRTGGSWGLALPILLARTAPCATPQAWPPAWLLGPSSPGRVPGQTVWPAAQAGIGDGQSRGKSREDANGAREMGQAKLPALAPQTTAFPAGPPLAQHLPAKPTFPEPQGEPSAGAGANPAPQDPTAPALLLGTAHASLAPPEPHGTG